MGAWDEGRLLEVLSLLRSRRGDSASVEVKRAAGGLPQNLVTTLCAFGNMPAGGTVILGIDERAGFRVTGVEDPARLEAGVASLARNGVAPPLNVSTHTVWVTKQRWLAPVLARRLRAADREQVGRSTFRGVPVVVVQVQGLGVEAKPARVGSSSGVAYLRQADGDYEMSDSELRMIEVAKLHSSQLVVYDDAPVAGTSSSDLDQDLVGVLVQNIRKDSSRLAGASQDQLLDLLRVRLDSDVLSVAGLYALGFFPQGPLPSLSVTVAQRLADDGSGRRTSGLKRITGPLPELLSQTMDWIRTHLQTVQRYDPSGDMIDQSEIPLGAVREAVANALVHRDLGPDTLGIGQSVDIRLTPQALIITNPGGLRGLSLKRLLSAELSRNEVNPRLYSLCTHLRTSEGKRVIEGERGGIHEILSQIKQAKLPAPLFIDYGVRFTVKIFRPGSLEQPASPEPGAPAISEQSAPAQGTGETYRPAETGPATGRSEQGELPDSPNAKAVMQVLKGQESAPVSVKEISQRTGLKPNQVRYTLRSLMQAGQVQMTLPQTPQSKNQKYRPAQAD